MAKAAIAPSAASHGAKMAPTTPIVAGISRRDTPKTDRDTPLIVRTLIHMTNEGLSQFTIKVTSQKLNQIRKHADLLNPDEVKNYIATAKVIATGEHTAPTTKKKLADSYDTFCKVNDLIWEKPHFKYTPKIPLIPKTENVIKIISHVSTKYATIFTILAETGAEGQELHTTHRKDIDAEQGIISIKGTKGHLSGNYKLKPKTTEMLRHYLAKYTQDYPFPPSKAMGKMWSKARARAIRNLCQPDLKNIPLKNLRNYSGAQLYYKLKDPIAVMRHLRHKQLETTMHYIRGMTLEKGDDYTCKTATNINDATQLIENGFEYITEIDGYKLFRKRK